jgi:hypothetical protein
MMFEKIFKYRDYYIKLNFEFRRSIGYAHNPWFVGDNTNKGGKGGK